MKSQTKYDDIFGSDVKITTIFAYVLQCLVDEVEALLMEQERQDQLRHEYYHQYG